MPLDAVVVSALSKELDKSISGGRIDKVQQPEKDMLLISLRSKGENLRLLISIGTGSARVQLTRRSMENPAEPPMFCMLMRKHLVGARIVSVSQPNFERLLAIELDCHDELGISSRKKLIIELIGRSSNLILVGADGRIIDCMRRMDYAGDALRRLLPGMIYRLPPVQAKPCLFDVIVPDIKEICSGADETVPMEKWLLCAFAGLSPLICRELSYRCGNDPERLPSILEALRESVLAGELSPCIIRRGDVAADFSYMHIGQYGAETGIECFDDFSSLLDSFYSRRDLEESRRRRSHQLMKTVRTMRDRLERKLAGQRLELSLTDKRDEVRKTAELITANIYRIKKGDRVLSCTDYYDPACPEISIELDPLKSPQQNAAAMFKAYNKLKGAKEHLTVLVEQGDKQLDYLNSVIDEIERAETEADLSAIRRELLETGYIKQHKNRKPDKNKLLQPHKYTSSEGLEILAGRNNAQNDELTTRLARRTDIWLHTQKVHGSHVIIRCDGLEPSKETLAEAACIAVYHSQSKGGGKTPVDYTMVRNVRKPSGSLPGKVIYTEYRTLMAEADEETVTRLRNKK